MHCKYAPAFGTFNEQAQKWEDSKQQNERDLKWYKRVIDGRLWGCSANLSKLKIQITEEDAYFEKEEKLFFQQNKADIYNLGYKVIAREKQRHAKTDEATRTVLTCTDEDIERKHRFLTNVYVHPILSKMKKGGHMQKLLHDQKLTASSKNQLFINA